MHQSMSPVEIKKEIMIEDFENLDIRVGTISTTRYFRVCS
jgi:hypothetical protein